MRDGRRGELVRSGVEVAIVGPPNAGKSTLLNVLARRDAAIVADVPGTTRDVLEVRLDLGGVAVIARDTAGLRRRRRRRRREATGVGVDDDSAGEGEDGDEENEDGKGAGRDGYIDDIEAEGIRRARAAAADAHLVIFVVDATNAPEAVAAFQQMMDEDEDECHDQRGGGDSGNGVNGSSDSSSVVVSGGSDDDVYHPSSADAMDYRYDDAVTEERWVPEYQREQRPTPRRLPPVMLVLNKCDQFDDPNSNDDSDIEGGGSRGAEDVKAALASVLASARSEAAAGAQADGDDAAAAGRA